MKSIDHGNGREWKPPHHDVCANGVRLTVTGSCTKNERLTALTWFYYCFARYRLNIVLATPYFKFTFGVYSFGLLLAASICFQGLEWHKFWKMRISMALYSNSWGWAMELNPWDVRGNWHGIISLYDIEYLLCMATKHQLRQVDVWV
jgi:hypothetical protein